MSVLDDLANLCPYDGGQLDEDRKGIVVQVQAMQAEKDAQLAAMTEERDKWKRDGLQAVEVLARKLGTVIAAEPHNHSTLYVSVMSLSRELEGWRHAVENGTTVDLRIGELTNQLAAAQVDANTIAHQLTGKVVELKAEVERLQAGASRMQAEVGRLRASDSMLSQMSVDLADARASVQELEQREAKHVRALERIAGTLLIHGPHGGEVTGVMRACEDLAREALKP